MAEDYKGSLHDIDHFLKVYAWAKAIGEKEIEDAESREVLEVAAILHDIACPRCREKYGHAAGPLQEQEGMPMTRELLAPFHLPESFVERVVWLVGHHHTVSGVETPEHRVLLEADYLVNAGEQGQSRAQMEAAEKEFFRTKTGIELLHSVYLK
ncbi:MAG: HD domain-containing protein [Ruminococcaceae bacterium]|nr:HD domain-containing protein [Oscillospiraceae bacterium]